MGWGLFLFFGFWVVVLVYIWFGVVIKLLWFVFFGCFGLVGFAVLCVLFSFVLRFVFCWVLVLAVSM